MFQPLSQAAPQAPCLTKIDIAGNALPTDATEWFAVRVLDGSIRFDMLASDVGDKRMTHAEAAEACAALTTGGYADWRLPTDREFSHIIDRTRFGPAVTPAFFPSIQSAAYWSSSPDASDPDDAWFVDFGNGYVLLGARGYNAWVRAVRSVPASQ